MQNLQRVEIKYCRDGIKAQYPKGNKCYICNSTESLEFHHYTPLVYLWEGWKKKNNISISSVDDIMDVRYDFYDDHRSELLGDCITLCKEHHAKLHSIYGKTYSGAPFMTKKVRRWVEIQRSKHELDK